MNLRGNTGLGMKLLFDDASLIVQSELCEELDGDELW